MTVEEFEALPPHIWMDVKKTLPPLEHPVLTVDAYGDYHTNTEYIDNPGDPVLHHLQQRPFLAADCMEQIRPVEMKR